MAAYRRVYDSRHLQADCKQLGSAPEPYARNGVWATFCRMPSLEVALITLTACSYNSDL